MNALVAVLLAQTLCGPAMYDVDLSVLSANDVAYLDGSCGQAAVLSGGHLSAVCGACRVCMHGGLYAKPFRAAVKVVLPAECNAVAGVS